MRAARLAGPEGTQTVLETLGAKLTSGDYERKRQRKCKPWHGFGNPRPPSIPISGGRTITKRVPTSKTMVKPESRSLLEDLTPQA